MHLSCLHVRALTLLPLAAKSGTLHHQTANLLRQGAHPQQACDVAATDGPKLLRATDSEEHCIFQGKPVVASKWKYPRAESHGCM